MQIHCLKTFSAFIIGIMVLFSASAKAYEEGTHYIVLEEPLGLRNSGKKEVIQFFSYACGWSNYVESDVVNWENSKPKEVDFHKIPVSTGYWEIPGRAKFVAKELGLGQAFDATYFYAVHSEGNESLTNNTESAINFTVNETGKTKEVIEKIWYSDKVNSQIEESKRMWWQSKASGVPIFIVNGKYQVTMDLRDMDEFFRVVEFLLDKKLEEGPSNPNEPSEPDSGNNQLIFFDGFEQG